MKDLGDLLATIKGGGQLNQPAQRTAVQTDADDVLRPLMDLLDGESCRPFSLIVIHFNPYIQSYIHQIKSLSDCS